jgi:hypothetical protein
MSTANEREIFEELRAQGKTIARIDERTERMDKEQKEGRADHEGRIRSLEFSREKSKGVMAALGAAGGIAVQCVISLFKYLLGTGGGN